MAFFFVMDRESISWWLVAVDVSTMGVVGLSVLFVFVMKERWFSERFVHKELRSGDQDG